MKGKETIMVALVLFINALTTASFIAAACYLADGHPVMAAWCIFGALVSGYNIKVK